MYIRKRDMAFFGAGVGVATITPKVVPKLGVVKATMFNLEVFRAYGRLQKILIEEYYRIDEAIEAETKFLEMINPRNRWVFKAYSFEVHDHAGQRTLHFQFKAREDDGS